MAIVFPERELGRLLGIEPDLIEVLWEDALRTSVLNSAVVRSAIERKWRGANGEVFGVAGLEYERIEGFVRLRRALLAERMAVEEAMICESLFTVQVQLDVKKVVKVETEVKSRL